MLCLSCSRDGTLSRGGKHPLLPCQLQIHSELQTQQKPRQVCQSHQELGHHTPDPRTGIGFWGVTATQLQERDGHSHCNSPPWTHLSRHQRKAGWILTRQQLKSKTRRCLKVTDIERDSIYNFLSSNQKEHKVVVQRSRDVTALPGHHVAPAKAVTHGTAASSHQQTTGNNKGMPESDL